MNEQSEAQPLLHSVPDARVKLGKISNTTFYELVKAGRLKICKIGTRSFVADAELQRFVADAANGGEA